MPRVRVFSFCPRLPAGKARGLSMPALGGRARPCARLGLAGGVPRGPVAGRSRRAAGPGWLAPAWLVRGGVLWLVCVWWCVRCGSWCGGCGGAPGVVAGWLGVGLGSGWGRAGFCGSGRAWLAAAGAAGSGLSGEWSGGPSGPSGFGRRSLAAERLPSMTNTRGSDDQPRDRVLVTEPGQGPSRGALCRPARRGRPLDTRGTRPRAP
jgi:hypothetical protein